MAKKDFTAEAAGVFVDKMITSTPTEKPTAKAKPAAPKQPRAQGTAPEVKATFMLDADIERKLRYIAYAERSKQKTIINDALRNYIDDYERTHGKIR